MPPLRQPLFLTEDEKQLVARHRTCVVTAERKRKLKKAAHKDRVKELLNEIYKDKGLH